MNSLLVTRTAPGSLRRRFITTVLALTALSVIGQTPGQITIFPAVEIEFGTESGKLYQLQGSSNLIDWSAVGLPQCGTGRPATLLFSTRGLPNFHFYRLQIPLEQPGCVPPAPRGLVLIGQSEHVTTAANFLGAGGLNPGRNTLPAPDDVVLFTVSAVDGPMPETRSQIDAIKGKPHGPAAIFLVNGFQQPDPELRDLVVLEIRNLLKSLQQPGVDAMPVIVDDQATALDLIRALIAQGLTP